MTLRPLISLWFCAAISAVNATAAAADDSLPAGAVARLKSAISDKARLVTSVAFFARQKPFITSTATGRTTVSKTFNSGRANTEPASVFTVPNADLVTSLKFL